MQDFMDGEAATWDAIKSKWKREHLDQPLPQSKLNQRPSILDDWLTAAD
jgi:hypothetical protein